MDKGTQEVKIGTEVVNSAGESFKEIVTMINQISLQIKSVADAMRHLENRNQDVVLNMEEIGIIAQKKPRQHQRLWKNNLHLWR